MSDFCHLLTRASHVFGSLRGVASVLDVPPLQVYRWLAEIDRPSGEAAMQLAHRLRSALVELQANS